MKFIRPILYCLSLALWLAYAILFPTWIGRFYNPDNAANPMLWYDGGTFGLKDGDSSPFDGSSPMWNPPAPYADDIQAPVRWPWQPVAGHNYVELDIAAMAFRISFGVIVLGILYFAFNWIRPAKKPDPVLRIAMTEALWQVIAWLGIGVLIAVTAGFGATDEVIIGTLAGCGVAGLVHGVSMRPKNGALPVNAPTASWGFLWFVLGLIAGIALAVLALQIAAQFRGPVIGVWELGTPRYANDQRPVDVWTGVALAAAGWTIGSILKAHWPKTRVFARGLIVAATALGILSAFRK